MTTMHDELTDRQQAILDFVRERIAVDGLPPTWAEIARAFGFRQTRAAQKHLQAIAAKGYLTLLPGKARGIRLSGSGLPGANARIVQLQLPVLGRVAAGAPIGADAGVERMLMLDPAMFTPRPDYLLRVHGDSMRDEGILDGDLVAVHATPVARHGQVVAARVRGSEFTIKRLHWKGDVIRLMPNSPGFKPIDVDPTEDFAIEGLFAGLLRGS